MKREHRDVVERKIRITDVQPTNLQQLLMWSYCNIPDPKQFSDKNWREFELLLHLCLNTTTYFKHVLCPKLASVIVIEKYIWLPLCLSSNLLPKQGGKIDVIEYKIHLSFSKCILSEWLVIAVHYAA